MSKTRQADITPPSALRDFYRLVLIMLTRAKQNTCSTVAHWARLHSVTQTLTHFLIVVTSVIVTIISHLCYFLVVLASLLHHLPYHTPRAIVQLGGGRVVPPPPPPRAKTPPHTAPISHTTHAIKRLQQRAKTSRYQYKHTQLALLLAPMAYCEYKRKAQARHKERTP